MGGLFVGATMLFVMSKCTARWFRRVSHNDLFGDVSILNETGYTDAYGVSLTYLLHAMVDCISIHLYWALNGYRCYG